MTVFGYKLMIYAVQLEITIPARISGRATPMVSFFFAVFEESSISINSDIQTNSGSRETSQQNSGSFFINTIKSWCSWVLPENINTWCLCQSGFG